MKKFSKKLIWYRLIINILPSIMIGIFTFSFFMPEEEAPINPEIFKIAAIISFILTIISYIILAIYQVLYYKYSGYELKENEIICTRGVLFKKKSIVEYKKIHAINSKQNIFEKFFNLAVLQVDSGSTNTAHAAEIQIIEEDEIVKQLMQQIKAKQNNEQVIVQSKNESNKIYENVTINKANVEIESVYNFNSKRKAIYTFLQVAWVLVVGIISTVIAAIILSLLIVLRQIDVPLMLLLIGVILLIFIVMSIIGFVFGLIGSLIAYYNFKLIRTKYNVEVSYGLFTRVNNTFRYNKIKAIRITQSIIQKLFGFATIKVEVIGYTIQTENDNQTASTGILVPLCKKSEINKILGNLLPNYLPIERQYKSKEYFPFISYHLLFSFISFALIQMIFTIFFTYYGLAEALSIASAIIWIVYVLYISFVLVERKLAQINSGFSLEDGKLCIYRGSFVQEIIVMRKQNIIGIDAKTTRFRRKKNIFTYKIHFRSNASTNTVSVANIDKEAGKQMYNLIRY